ncbi:MAG: hypothetical protein J6B28_09070 [Eubacterium sp.]|nr:hypothetical protein [Eubacterium sp.]
MLEKSKGITNFQLKYIAMIAMVLDIVRDNENNLCSAQENCYNKNI